MARRRSKRSDAALVGLLLIIGLPIWLFQNHPAVATIVVIIILAVLVLSAHSRTCEICGVQLKRVLYRWEIDGKRKVVCPNCNRTLERRQSDRALANK